MGCPNRARSLPLFAAYAGRLHLDNRVVISDNRTCMAVIATVARHHIRVRNIVEMSRLTGSNY